jgi:tetratricopeptide (TPR) repeat protein
VKDFFISYTGQDKLWAEWVAWILEESGYSVVIQAWDFRVGGNFVLDMQRATIEAKQTIAIFSSTYLDKSFPKAEWAAAFAQDPTSEIRKLIPIRVDTCTPRGLLGQINYVDIFDCDEAEAQERLLAAVKDGRLKPTHRPRFPGKPSLRQQPTHAPFPGSSTESDPSVQTTPNHPLNGEVECEKELTDERVGSGFIASPNQTNFTITSALGELSLPPVIFQRPKLQEQGIQLITQGTKPVLLIQGLSGFGKTVLMSEIAKYLSKDFSYILPIRLSGPNSFEPSYLAEVINNFLETVDPTQSLKNLKELGIQSSLPILLSRLFELNVLILIDDVRETYEAHLESLTRALNTFQKARLILTSRYRALDRKKSHILTVLPFSENETRTFIEQYSQAMAIQIDADSLVQQLPRSIKENPQALSLILSNLEDIPAELMLMQGFSDDITLFECLIDEILSGLNEKAQQNLIIISILENLDLSASLKVLAIEPASISLIESINLLLHKSLIYRKDTTYSMPSLVKDFVCQSKSLSKVRDYVISQIVEAMKRYGDRFNSSNDKTSIDIAVQIIANLFHYLYNLEKYDELLSLSTEDFLEEVNRRGLWKEYWLMLNLIFISAQKVSDEQKLASAGLRIARKSFQVKDLEKGRQTLAILERYSDLDKDEKLHAEILSHKALFTERDNDVNLALEQLHESLAIRNRIGDQEGASIVNKLIGNIYIRQHEYQRARQSYNRALEILSPQERSSKLGLEIRTSLTLCDIADEEFDPAESSLRQIISECCEISYTAGLPRAYYALAQTLDSKEEFHEALDYANKAVDIAAHTDREIAKGAAILIWKIQNLELNDEE